MNMSIVSAAPECRHIVLVEDQRHSSSQVFTIKMYTTKLDSLLISMGNFSPFREISVSKQVGLQGFVVLLFCYGRVDIPCFRAQRGSSSSLNHCRLAGEETPNRIQPVGPPEGFCF